MFSFVGTRSVFGAGADVTALQKAAGQGDAAAQLQLGQSYYIGRGVEKDVVKAAQWFQKAAAQGHREAQYYLGTMYRAGQGVEKDAAKATLWYQKAADQGHVAAQFNVGTAYRFGWGVPKDEAKVAEWYQKAADQGHAKAQEELKKMGSKSSTAERPATQSPQKGGPVVSKSR